MAEQSYWTVVLGVGLWVLWTFISALTRMISGYTDGSIPCPANWIEGLLAIAVASSAGFCEEIVFRGYLQRQLYALSGSVAVAVVLQAAIFRIPHMYQGA